MTEPRGRLDHPLNASLPSLNALACAARIVAGFGWSLLFLVAVSLLTMPITQRLWNWDHFLRGGQDFELSVFLVLSFFCLVLVLSRHCKQCVDSLFAAGSRLAYEPSDQRRGGASLLGAFPLRAKCPGDPTRDLFSLPLQI